MGEKCIVYYCKSSCWLLTRTVANWIDERRQSVTFGIGQSEGCLLSSRRRLISRLFSGPEEIATDWLSCLTFAILTWSCNFELPFVSIPKNTLNKKNINSMKAGTTLRKVHHPYSFWRMEWWSYTKMAHIWMNMSVYKYLNIIFEYSLKKIDEFLFRYYV